LGISEEFWSSRWGILKFRCESTGRYPEVDLLNFQTQFFDIFHPQRERIEYESIVWLCLMGIVNLWQKIVLSLEKHWKFWSLYIKKKTPYASRWSWHIPRGSIANTIADRRKLPYVYYNYKKKISVTMSMSMCDVFKGVHGWVFSRETNIWRFS
jgi:hypothetical protein